MKRNVHYDSYTAHFLYKTMAFFPQKTACVLLSKHLQYISIHAIQKQ